MSQLATTKAPVTEAIIDLRVEPMPGPGTDSLESVADPANDEYQSVPPKRSYAIRVVCVEVRRGEPLLDGIPFCEKGPFDMEPKDWIALAGIFSTAMLSIVTLLINSHRERRQQDRDERSAKSSNIGRTNYGKRSGATFLTSSSGSNVKYLAESTTSASLNA